ncbi:helix-turn-helix domain-containing protein [Pediococcus pentosaceus]|uniref:helix-turn-helix domain-containing protein n=1 Tax=Pediococcus pentosaceus TaxID=1255 RepID=UPI00201729AF|nr:helix-turn-helix transcriptional regulator [Pediococcus pentosaceus]MCL3857782.1 helix-turn-helix domain-containing protein [Pediococcus pentosaceus]
MTTFERIKKIAKKRGFNLKQVAKMSGMKSENAIYRYNQGVTPRDSTLRSIAEALDTSFEYLKGQTDDDAPHNPNKRDMEVEEALNSVRMYQGKPISDAQRETMKGIIRAYLDAQDKNE